MISSFILRTRAQWRSVTVFEALYSTPSLRRNRYISSFTHEYWVEHCEAHYRIEEVTTGQSSSTEALSRPQHRENIPENSHSPREFQASRVHLEADNSPWDSWTHGRPARFSIERPNFDPRSGISTNKIPKAFVSWTSSSCNNDDCPRRAATVSSTCVWSTNSRQLGQIERSCNKRCNMEKTVTNVRWQTKFLPKCHPRYFTITYKSSSLVSGKSDECFLCHNKRGNIAHILNNCPLCLDRYTWRHDSVLACLKLAIEDHLRRKQSACRTHCTNCLRHTSCPKQSSSLLTQIPFVKSSENTSTSSQASPPSSSLLPSNSSSRSTSSSSSSSSYHSPSSFAPCSSSSSFSSPVSTVPISHSPLSPSTNKTNVNHRAPKSSKSKPKKCPLFDTLLDGAIDWKTCWDLNYINGLKRRNSFPVEIAACTQMPDGILWSLRLRRIVLVELTVPWEENMHDANLRKRIRYENLSKMLTDLSWDVHLFSIEVGSRGYVGTSTNILLSKLGISSVDRKALRSKISNISLHCSYVIWLNRACAIWHPRLPLRSLEELAKPM